MSKFEEFTPTAAQVEIQLTAARAFDQRAAGVDRMRFILPEAQGDLGFTWENKTPTKHRTGEIGECWMASYTRLGDQHEILFCVLAHGEEFMVSQTSGRFYRKVEGNG